MSGQHRRNFHNNKAEIICKLRKEIQISQLKNYIYLSNLSPNIRELQFIQSYGLEYTPRIYSTFYSTFYMLLLPELGLFLNCCADHCQLASN